MKYKPVPYNPNHKERAKELRKTMTFSEVLLWNCLKNFQMMGYDFDRQRIILNYIVDFYSKDLNLVIEVDGITHQDEIVFFKDEIRDQDLNKISVSVLRINALDIINRKKYVLQIIENWILDFEDKYGTAPNVIKRRLKR
jgi:very-short-patch-repair endonuclease